MNDGLLAFPQRSRTFKRRPHIILGMKTDTALVTNVDIVFDANVIEYEDIALNHQAVSTDLWGMHNEFTQSKIVLPYSGIWRVSGTFAWKTNNATIMNGYYKHYHGPLQKDTGEALTRWNVRDPDTTSAARWTFVPTWEHYFSAGDSWAMGMTFAAGTRVAAGEGGTWAGRTAGEYTRIQLELIRSYDDR